MPSFYRINRSSRHRTACFALYKELIRRAREIPVPDTIVPVETKKHGIAMHPTLPVIRKGFKQNRHDQSRHVIYVALKAGYQFLDVLDKAKVAGSEDHARMIRFLEQWTADAQAAADAAEERAELERQRKARVPNKLLERRPVPSQPGGTFSDARVPYYFYEYAPVSRPKPLSELKASIDGRRRVPVMATDAVGIPFLRLGKPQPWLLSVMIHVKRSKRLRRMGLASRMLREDLAFAAEEDRWEAVIANQLKRQQQQQQQQGRHHPQDYDEYTPPEESTYAGAVSIGIQYLWSRLNTESADMALRAKAMLDLVNAEQALKDQEEEEFRKKEAAEAAKAQAAEAAGDATGDGTGDETTTTELAEPTETDAKTNDRPHGS